MWTPRIEEFPVHMSIVCYGRALHMTPVELISRPEESWLECIEINVDLRLLLASSRYRSPMHLLILLTRILKSNFSACLVFFQILAKLKPKHLKVVGAMAMVRNSVGSGKQFSA